MKPLTSRALRNAFDNAGYVEVRSDKHHWAMARDHSDIPFMVPRGPGLISARIVAAAASNGDQALRNAILAEIAKTRPRSDPPPSGSPAE